MTLTAHQDRAIHERGNLLVMAAAGAGKTGTLVQRCLRLFLRTEDPVPVRRLLVVTFTEAAAAEVRERIRHKLEEAATANPTDEHLQEQLANLDSAYISTLHSFCFQLIRKHVLQLELDPTVKVLEPYQSKIYFQQTLDALLREHYEEGHTISAELKKLIRSHYGGWVKPVRGFVESLHEFTQTRPDPQGWFARELTQLAEPNCPKWHEWYREAILEWCNYWISYLESLPSSNKNAHACAALLKKGRETADITVPARILARDQEWPEGQKTEHKKLFGKLFDEADFFASLQPEKDGRDPLDEDWEWMRQPLRTLLLFAQQFSERFRSDKLERGVLDFHDLEQFTLKLLIDPKTGKPSALAGEWQDRFEAVFVDEYQDINAAQDLILTALSSHVPPGNRFLVGDVKQSIYRFRQADPSIFQQYVQRTGWKTIPLSENFRSHEGLLKFVNPLFKWLMKPAFGGLDYTDDAALKFGNAAERAEMLCKPGGAPRVEFHLYLTDHEPERDDNEEEPEIEEAEAEARLVASRLRAMKESGLEIYDQREKRARPVDWQDMVVLLRAAKNRVETYAKAFAAAGVPLQTKRNVFFSTQEVLDLCSVLNILDNPLQDIPLVAVLRSPMAGLTANDLATIRIHSSATPFWRALNEVYDRNLPDVPMAKIEKFLKQFHSWRIVRRCSSLAQRLELILTDTGYGDWLLAQPRGRERSANVQQLVRIARQFDESRGESLYLFLRHLEELQDAAGDIEPAGCVEENAVRLMTVHQSKGLEFPVVAIADLGKQFNMADQGGGVKMHDQYGLCSMVKPPHTGQRYPSLPLWLARRAERFENIGEEIRILYVALTRAQNHLLLFGSSTEKRAARWDHRATEQPHTQQTLQHRCWLDWLGTYVSLKQLGWSGDVNGTLDTLSFEVHRRAPTLENQTAEQTPADVSGLKLALDYPHAAATRMAAKTSVTALRKKAEIDEESASLAFRYRGEREGTERGLATHTFLEHLSLTGPMETACLRAEAERLVTDRLLTPDQTHFIDMEGIIAFWKSEVGHTLLKRPQEVTRELPFTFKATNSDLVHTGLSQILGVPENEFVIIQGVADLLWIAPEEIWLIDFKSDRLERKELKNAIERYKPQVLLYATALSAIYGRPVTRKGIFFLNLREFYWFEARKNPAASSQQLELRL